MAAYIIEETTGERFEDYVARTWFTPLAMAGASYFMTPDRAASLATGYGRRGETISCRFNILLRPAGGIVASPREMANLDGSEDALLDAREPTDAEMIQWLRRREDHLLGLQDA